jgi:PPOX class probable F420-dependent enzyme
MDSVLPDPSTPQGERFARRLAEERIGWLTTVGADGTPQPNPVWFLWDQGTILIYSLPNAARLPHIRRNSRVSLNLNSNAQGGDILVLTGDARISTDEPPADQVPAYVAKYGEAIARSFGTPANFAAQYSTPIRITPTKARGG